MATITDLQASADALTSAVNDVAVRVNTEISNLQSQAGQVPDAVVAQIQAASAALAAIVPAP